MKLDEGCGRGGVGAVLLWAGGTLGTENHTSAPGRLTEFTLMGTHTHTHVQTHMCTCMQTHTYVHTCSLTHMCKHVRSHTRQGRPPGTELGSWFWREGWPRPPGMP